MWLSSRGLWSFYRGWLAGAEVMGECLANRGATSFLIAVAAVRLKLFSLRWSPPPSTPFPTISGILIPLHFRRQPQPPLPPFNLYKLKCDKEPLNSRLGPPDFNPQTPNCSEETLTKEYLQSGYRDTVEGLEEKELAAVKINAADVDIIANELELDKKVAERTLRCCHSSFAY
ncbi:unnamed protein product [Vicia faba]|uniref:Nascent polypeptide-associated complex subunit alpha-like UBA domain-containing protein n=1 Tax=Vicia faba TaxID=3906 RepID=A0AAV1AWT9_VICFA|nr:unnamed protein product [Vicia faba]